MLKELKRDRQLTLKNVNKDQLLSQQVFSVIKPIGYSSNDIVQIIKKQFGFKKVGHGGTLDPLASGVLVIGIENGTKQLTHHLSDHKSYDVLIKLGEYTNSYDLATEVTKTAKIPNLTLEDIKNTIDNCFIKKDYYQTSPSYSAKKINGIRAYELARNNQLINLKPNLVKINSFKVNDYDEVNHIINISLNVSKGFYIRSFGVDLAKELKTLGVIISLIRTTVNEFNINNSYKFE